MRKYIFFLSVILMGACQSPAVFEKYEEQPDEVWNRYHIVEFTADIPDSGQYIVKLCLRHTTDYEMANLWCFVSTRSHGQELLSDTENLKSGTYHFGTESKEFTFKGFYAVDYEFGGDN